MHILSHFILFIVSLITFWQLLFILDQHSNKGYIHQDDKFLKITSSYALHSKTMQLFHPKCRLFAIYLHMEKVNTITKYWIFFFYRKLNFFRLSLYFIHNTHTHTIRHTYTPLATTFFRPFLMKKWIYTPEKQTCIRIPGILIK